jgi:hypothetical protein
MSWLLAFAEAKDRHKTEFLRGLRWARNRIAHGVLTSAPASWRFGAELDRLLLDKSALGTRSGHEWLSREVISTSRTQKKDAAGEVAYDKHLAGQNVLDALREGLAEATRSR